MSLSRPSLADVPLVRSATRLSLAGWRVPRALFESFSLFALVLATLFLAVSTVEAQTTPPSLDGTPTTQGCSACSSLNVALPAMSNSSGDFIVTEVATYGSAYSAFPPQGYLLIGPTPTREYRRISCWCMDISRNRTIPRVSPSLCHRMRPQCRSWPLLTKV